MSSLYGFAYSDAAIQYLDTMPKKFRAQIVKWIKALATDPHPQGSKPLRDVMDGDKPVYRLRQGKYRVLYSLREGRLIAILDIGLRKDVYRKE